MPLKQKGRWIYSREFVKYLKKFAEISKKYFYKNLLKFLQKLLE